MLDKALEVLKKIEQAGFEAYIVGGFVRDYYLGNLSDDIDITTNAKPRDIKNIFEDAEISPFNYGAVELIYKKQVFEITTYRSENNYIANRKPENVEYIDSLMDDLMRRDFTINTLCMDRDGVIIDLFKGIKDIDDKIIRVVGDPKQKLEEDVLRMLRAIRFATTLNFELDNSIVDVILKNGYLLKKLSYTRKKEELHRIFKSSNVGRGIELLLALKLVDTLELEGLDKVVVTNDPNAIYAQLNLMNYPFSKLEKNNIDAIKEIIKSQKIDCFTLYNYGLYPSIAAAPILGINSEEVSKLYALLPIKSRREINISIDYLCNLFNKKPGRWLKDIYNILEKELISGKIENKKEDIDKLLEKIRSDLDANGKVC